MNPDNIKTRPTISVVVPAFNEEGNISILCERLRTVLDNLDESWEILIVDDGSTDDTWKIIESIHTQDGRVRGLRLSRNFGHQFALYAGLQHASGQAVVSMDADLQHPPDCIPLLVQHWRQGSKIVNTIRLESEKLSLTKRWSSKLFYAIFSYLSGVQVSNGMADFRLLDRIVVDELLKFKEEGLFLRGLVQWVGYANATVEYQCGERHSGKSKYSLRRMLHFAWHGISSFSIVPLRMAIALGIATSLISFLWLANALYAKLVTGSIVPGWASTVGILSFLFGIMFLLLGIIGEYIGRILEQVRQRPLFIVADTVGIEPE